MARAERVAPVLDPHTRGLIEILNLNPTDSHAQELLEIQIQAAEVNAESLNDPLIQNCPPRGSLLISEPSICMGRMSSDEPLPWPISRVPSGAIGTGPPGSTKTTLFIWAGIQMVMYGLLVLVFDIKGSWRKLADYALLGGKVTVLNVRDLMLSVLQPPPSVEQNEWYNRFTRVFALAYGRFSAQRLLRDIIERVSASCPRGIYLTPRILIDQLENFKARNAREREYVPSLLWVLKDICNNFGEAFEFTSSDFFEKLFKQSGRLVIIEDCGLPSEHWNFIIALFLEWIFAFRRNNPTQRQYEIAFVLEDATSLLDAQRDRETPGGVSLIAQNLNLCREMRIGIIPVVHSLRQISPKILADVESLFVCSLRGDDIYLAQRILGITAQQAEALRVNPRGTACALCPSVWPHAVMIHYPPLPENL